MGLTETNNSLEQLLSACVLKNRQAFADLYKQTSAKLFGVQLRILKDRAIAEEALQEAYLKIWNNADRFRPQAGSALVWMMRIARNQAIDVLRKQQRKNANEATGEAWDTVLNFVSHDDGDVDSSDRDILAVCLQRIRKEFKVCLVKIYCEGYTQEELSQRLGKPLGTIKSWVRRGTQWLKTCYDELS